MLSSTYSYSICPETTLNSNSNELKTGDWVRLIDSKWTTEVIGFNGCVGKIADVVSKNQFLVSIKIISPDLEVYFLNQWLGRHEITFCHE